jgi:hypothetical protein
MSERDRHSELRRELDHVKATLDHAARAMNVDREARRGAALLAALVLTPESELGSLRVSRGLPARAEAPLARA